MDEQEVERVAKLMQAAFVEQHAKKHPGSKNLVGFDGLSANQKETMLYVARAIVADRLGLSVQIADEYAPTFTVNAG